MKESQISGMIIDAAMKIHKLFGPGLLETAYQACLKYELSNQSLSVEADKSVPISYEGTQLYAGFRVDLMVEDLVLVELEVADEITPVHEAKLQSYLKLSGKQLGLLINFKVLRLKEGIRRFSN